jgi:hypothetical protein
MSTYDPLSRITYHDYLEAKSFVRDITSEVSSQGRALVASQQQLVRNGISIRETLKNEVGGAIEVLSQTANETVSAIRELEATFRWEFAELLAVTGRMAGTLEELLHVSKAPEQNWASEQYEIAQDCVRRQLFDDALEATQRAINGFSSHTGYKLDYRFHFLLGTIRLGSIRNSSDAILNHPAAERAFLDAAKYARADYPAEAARAFVAAGYAAYCQNNVANARRWTTEAIALNPKLAEAHFQQGKLNAHSGDGPGAVADLRTAILLAPLYAIRALDDGDYQKYAGPVTALLTELRDQARDAVQSGLASAERQYAQLKGAYFADYSFARDFNGNSAEQSLNEASEAFLRAGYIDYLECAQWLKDAIPKLNSVRREFLQRIENSLSSRLRALQLKLSEARSAKLPDDMKAIRKWGSVGIPVVAIFIGYQAGTVSGYVAVALLLFFIVIAPILFWLSMTFGPRIQKWPESNTTRLEIGRLERLRRDFPVFRNTLTSQPALLAR